MGKVLQMDDDDIVISPNENELNWFSGKAIGPDNKQWVDDDHKKVPTHKDIGSPHFTSKCLMVEPTCFFLNEETALDNKFMNNVKED